MRAAPPRQSGAVKLTQGLFEGRVGGKSKRWLVTTKVRLRGDWTVSQSDVGLEVGLKLTVGLRLTVGPDVGAAEGMAYTLKAPRNNIRRAHRPAAAARVILALAGWLVAVMSTPLDK
jgi:hypothetical protein